MVETLDGLLRWVIYAPPLYLWNSSYYWNSGLSGAMFIQLSAETNVSINFSGVISLIITVGEVLKLWWSFKVGVCDRGGIHNVYLHIKMHNTDLLGKCSTKRWQRKH